MADPHLTGASEFAAWAELAFSDLETPATPTPAEQRHVMSLDELAAAMTADTQNTTDEKETQA